MVHTAFLLLGTNLGDKQAQLNAAIQEITSQAGAVSQVSSMYETRAWGNTHQDDFLNCVCRIETQLEPLVLLSSLLSIEKQMGRERGNNQYMPRTIDIDILFYDDLICDSANLILPHPRLHLRNFTLTPLHEIVPDFVHPVFQKTVSELLQHSMDTLSVKKIVQH